ncbi:FCD domain-containing protein [Dactylosporangium sp. AC04546]|uniref:FadR/GntR family transcriptional regulator n=1 Tax=Dactylosporangium sp. AC04546 TaxID=2862460 RepID=UPI001EDE22C3|nr:FCD domain-containing protein [Dactylosporangium sp. AC04546]WVK88554.1 FCD domain-containing protein [Dactylosporangium sp. AC04546]
MALQPLRPSPLVEQATDRLRQQIAGGHWDVGAKLPSETALAATLGVGRSTVREALRALAGAGLVQARQGAGVFVIAREPSEDWAAQLRRAAVTDVYEVRVAVEVEAVRLAAARRTPKELARIEDALRRRTAAATEGDTEFVDADVALHVALVDAAHNPVLSRLFADFLPVLREGLVDMVQLLGLRAEHPNPGADTHAALVAAVAAGDADGAVRALRDELEQTLDRLRRQ